MTMPIPPPPFERPAAGTTGSHRFDVTLDTNLTDDGVSLRLRFIEEATVLIARRLLEQLQAAMPEKWSTEAERMARIQGCRAEILLQNTTKAADNFGCTPVQMPVPDDALYLVGALLESGQATVIDPAIHEPVPTVEVHFEGLRVGPLAGMGHVSYACRGTGPFLQMRWWTS